MGARIGCGVQWAGQSMTHSSEGDSHSRRSIKPEEGGGVRSEGSDGGWTVDPAMVVWKGRCKFVSISVSVSVCICMQPSYRLEDGE